MKINWTRVALEGILLLGLAAGICIYAKQNPAPTQPATEAPRAGTISLTVQGLYTNKQIDITSGETVLAVLQALTAKDPQLQLSIKEYAGLGALVMSMHGLKNGESGSYWQYKVNGVMPQIGAGSYKLKSGDSVDWFFGPSQE